MPVIHSLLTCGVWPEQTKPFMELKNHHPCFEFYPVSYDYAKYHDVFSFGIVVVELANGRHPFARGRPEEQPVVLKSRKILAGYSDELDIVVKNMTIQINYKSTNFKKN